MSLLRGSFVHEDVPKERTSECKHQGPVPIKPP